MLSIRPIPFLSIFKNVLSIIVCLLAFSLCLKSIKNSVKLIIPLYLYKKYKIIFKSSFGRFMPHSLRLKIKQTLFTLFLTSYDGKTRNIFTLNQII